MMTDLFVLIVPVIHGFLFLFCSWRGILRIDRENSRFHTFLLSFRFSISIWPFFQFILWIFTPSTSVRIIELLITGACCLLSFLFIVKDNYIIYTHQLTEERVKQLRLVTEGLFATSWFSIVFSFALCFRLLRWWIVGNSLILIACVLALLLVMAGIMMLAITRGKANVEGGSQG